MSDSKPLIGITTYRQAGQTGVWDGEFAMVPGDYLRGVENAGGVGVLLPPQDLSPAAAARIVQGLDGLMLCGGRDIEPARYGQVPLETTEKSDTLRDHTEDALLGAALEAGIPVLGICRGAQMLNVHRGGTLHQHVPLIVGDTRYQRGGGEFTMMPVTITPGSRLAEIFDGQDSLEAVAMYHHQAIDQLGEGLVVTAVSPDGIVEAIELEDYPFAVAVQWHPEKTLGDGRVFEALVKKAAQKRTYA